MLEKDTKEQIAEISQGVNKTLVEEKAKISKDLFKSPTVITISVFLLLAVGNSPWMILVLGVIFAIVVLFKSAPAVTIGSVAVKVSRDVIKNRKQIKEEAMKKAGELKASMTKKDEVKGDKADGSVKEEKKED